MDLLAVGSPRLAVRHYSRPTHVVVRLKPVGVGILCDDLVGRSNVVMELEKQSSEVVLIGGVKSIDAIPPAGVGPRSN